MKIYIRIVGHGKDKFTEKGKEEAKYLIASILFDKFYDYKEDIVIVSGHSPVGGIDIWAEEIAKKGKFKLDLKIPKQHKWNAEYGYKQRNIDIAKCSNEVHVILVDKYPPNYKGMRFNKCYHCGTNKHIKSGGCWTGHCAINLGKKVYWHIIKNY